MRTKRQLDCDTDCGPGNFICDSGFCAEICNAPGALSCPADSACVTVRAPFYSTCLRTCSRDADCDTANGFTCQTFRIAGGFAGSGCAR